MIIALGFQQLVSRNNSQTVLPKPTGLYWTIEPTHSFLNAKPAKANTLFPVILYSASGVMNANTLLSEELASHGYVLFSIGHSYWCEFYFDSEGKTTPLNKNNEYYKQLWKEEGYCSNPGMKKPQSDSLIILSRS